MNPFRKLSFQRQLTIALLFVTVLITLVTSIWSYQLALRQFREMSIDLTQRSVTTLQSSVQSYFSTVIEHTTEMLSGEALRKIANAPVGEEVRGFSNWQIMESDLQKQMALANKDKINFSHIEIHFKNGASFSTKRTYQFTDYADCIEQLSQNYEISKGYTGTHWLSLPSVTDNYRELSCFRYIYNARMEPIGIAIFSLNNTQVQRILSQVDSSFIMDTQGRILSAKDRTKVGTEYNNPILIQSIAEKPSSRTITYRIDGSEQMVSYSPVSTVNCYLVVPNTEYESIFKSSTSEYQRSVALMAVIGLLLSAAISFLLGKGISQNFKDLTGFIKKVSVHQNSGLRYKPNGNTEYDQIGIRINAMLDSLEEATRQKEANLRLTQALELRLLQAQLNPHLLYNTLNSVIWNLENSNGDNAVQLIASLSGYFQYALSDGKQCITLEDELKLIQYYLDLQKRARHKTFTFTIDIPEHILNASIPKLMLQPLVENSIRHGFDGYRDDGTIAIAASENNGIIELTVTDNGFGIMPDDLKELNTILNSQVPLSELKSFGLYGINRTVRQLYGNDFGLWITSEMDHFTTVTVRFPYRTGI